MDAVTITVMAKYKICHIAEARALGALGAEMIDESKVLTPADVFFHVDKRKFTVPLFVVQGTWVRLLGGYGKELQ